jgi:hypothetical protein
MGRGRRSSFFPSFSFGRAEKWEDLRPAGGDRYWNVRVHCPNTCVYSRYCHGRTQDEGSNPSGEGKRKHSVSTFPKPLCGINIVIYPKAGIKV